MELLVSTLIDADKTKRKINEVSQYYNLLGKLEDRIEFEVKNDCGEDFDWMKYSVVEYRRKICNLQLVLKYMIESKRVYISNAISIYGDISAEDVVVPEDNRFSPHDINLRCKNLYLLGNGFSLLFSNIRMDTLYIISSKDAILLDRGITKLLRGAKVIVYNKPIISDRTYKYIDEYGEEYRYTFNSTEGIEIQQIYNGDIDIPIPKEVLIQNAYNDTLEELRKYYTSIKFKLDKNIKIPSIGELQWNC